MFLFSSHPFDGLCSKSTIDQRDVLFEKRAQTRTLLVFPFERLLRVLREFLNSFALSLLSEKSVVGVTLSVA